MLDWNIMVSEHMHDLMAEAQNERLLKEAISKDKQHGLIGKIADAVGRQLILFGWRLLEPGAVAQDTCARTVLSRRGHALILCEVCT